MAEFTFTEQDIEDMITEIDNGLSMLEEIETDYYERKPARPTEEEFTARIDESRTMLQEQKAELENLLETLDFSKFTGE